MFEVFLAFAPCFTVARYYMRALGEDAKKEPAKLEEVPALLYSP
jgi:hypothetical protein